MGNRPLGRFPIVYVEPVTRGGWRAWAKRTFDLVGAGALPVLIPALRAPAYWSALVAITILSSYAYLTADFTQVQPPARPVALVGNNQLAVLKTNLVEGYARQGKKEFRQFVNIALGSLAEAKYLLGFALRLTYLKPEAHRHLHGQAEEVGRLLWKFYQSLGAKP